MVATTAAQQTTGKAKVNIGIAENHLLVQHAIQGLLRQKPAYDVVACSQTGRDTVRMVTSHALDVLVLDIDMPGSSGMDVLGEISTARPALKTVVYSALPEAHYALPMHRLGAVAYVEKTAAVGSLVDAIDDVLNGKRYFSPGILQSIEAGQPMDPTASHPKLTPREFQVFIRLAAGERVGELARSLGLSTVTVSTHRAAVLRKLQLRGNAELTRFALEHGYIQ
ncbi:MAG: response regulator transcription factor [Haliea sp.]|nr:MAG: response regulator transcription factor [Haliea sp.]